jgi:hypothetical protein
MPYSFSSSIILLDREVHANRSITEKQCISKTPKIRICLQVWFTEAKKKGTSETSMFTAEVAYETAEG